MIFRGVPTMHPLFVLTLLLCITHGCLEFTQVPSLRLKRETTNSVLPSWLENIVRKNGKRSKDQVLLFMKNIGIQFIRKTEDGDNSKTEVPSIRKNSNKPEKTVNNSLTQFNTFHLTQNSGIESVTEALNSRNNETTSVANKTKRTSKHQKLIVQNSDFLTERKANMSESAAKGEKIIDSNADDDEIIKRMHMPSTSKTEDSGVSKANAKTIQKEKTVETLQTSTIINMKVIQDSQTVIVTTPNILISISDKIPTKNLNFGRKIKSIFTR